MEKDDFSNLTADFQPDEESRKPKVQDGAKEIIGGMITDKTVKAHKDQSDDGFCHCGGSGREQ